MAGQAIPQVASRPRRRWVAAGLSLLLVVELVVLWFLGGGEWARSASSAALYRAGVSWQSWWGSWRDPRVGAGDLRCKAINTSGKRMPIPPPADRPVALVVSSGCSSCTMGSLRRWARFAQGHKDVEVWVVGLLDSQRSLQRWQAKIPAGLKWARASLQDLRPLNLRFVPRVYVFDKSGRLVWLQRQAFEHDEALHTSVAEAALQGHPEGGPPAGGSPERAALGKAGKAKP